MALGDGEQGCFRVVFFVCCSFVLQQHCFVPFLVLHCIVMCSSVPYRTVRYRFVPFLVLHCIVMCSSVPCRLVRYCTVPLKKTRFNKTAWKSVKRIPWKIQDHIPSIYPLSAL